MEPTFAEAVADVSEIMQFENWLRFYFLYQEEDELVVRIPEQAMAHFMEKYPNLAPLAEIMNNDTITYEKSVSTVCTFVVSSLDGKKYRQGVIPGVLDSPEFQNEMYLFQMWTQNHEKQLEQTPMEFQIWRQLFAEWKQSDSVQKLVQQEKQNAPRVTKCTTGTMQ